MKKMIAVLLRLIISIGVLITNTYVVPDWPSDVSIETEGGVIIDVDTGTILYSKNAHTPYFPTSITKILTILIVIEDCDLNETVIFSHNTVHNIESSSSGAGLDVGDTLSVWDCLYTMLLRPANEVANTLAEHMADTTEDFIALTNRRTASLGYQDSNSANPSRLNSPDHYIFVYDMALIGQVALRNETLMDIDPTLYHDLSVTKRNPGEAHIYPSHKMIKKNSAEYYSDVFGKKTDCTSLVGNTLVTFTKRDGTTLAGIVLSGYQAHYSDIRKLLDFGFQNSQSVVASDYDNTYTSTENDMTIAGLFASNLSGLMPGKTDRVTPPKDTDLSFVTSSIAYDLSGADPADAVVRIQYQLDDRTMDAAYLEFKTSDISNPAIPAATLVDITNITLESATMPEPGPVKKEPIKTPPIVWTVLTVAMALALLITIIIIVKECLGRKETSERNRRREKRLQWLQEIGYSPVESDLLTEQKRSPYTPESPKRCRDIKFPLREK